VLTDYDRRGMLQRGPDSLHRVVLPHDSPSHHNNHDYFFTRIVVSESGHFPSVTIVRALTATRNVYLLSGDRVGFYYFMHQSQIVIQI
jgi:hypothetical protein